MKNIFRVAFWILFLAASASCIVVSYRGHDAAEARIVAEAQAAREEAQQIRQRITVFTERAVPSRLSFAALLEEQGIDAPLASRMVQSAQSVFDMRHLRAGNQLKIGRGMDGDLRSVQYNIDADRVLAIEPAAGGADFHSEIQTVPSRSETAGVTGEIRASLFEAVIDAHEKPELAMRLAEIFGYDLDFYTDARPGDTFRVVVEKKRLANGDTISYGRILAAEYVNEHRPFRAVLFHDEAGHAAYYTPEGKSLKKAFLHSPLKFAAPITSHFSTHRFHPILKETRPHLGIDYGAPTGTPVQTIGDGRVVWAGMKGGAGNLVEIEHTNGYTTYYMHLSRVLVRNGQRVEQGERIGLVGMTGLATGPHLDFRISQRGQFLNFERLALPTSDPISKRDWNEFAEARDAALAQMPTPVAAPQPSLAKDVPSVPNVPMPRGAN